MGLVRCLCMTDNVGRSKKCPTGMTPLVNNQRESGLKMVNLYFCYDDKVGVQRSWTVVPRVGDSSALAELSGNLGPLVVSDVVWEGDGQPVATVFVSKRQAKAGAP